MTFADKAIAYFKALRPPGRLPPGVLPLYPHQSAAVQSVVQAFFTRFFADNHKRIILIGINPGRYGAGITGINFTAPRQLTNVCGIPHEFGDSSELSAEFIYEVIDAFGGVASFYRHFYLGSVSPIGFVKAGKNLNYYDDPALLEQIRPYAVQQLKKQLALGIQQTVAICIGGDKNYRFLHSLNAEYGFFDEIRTVPHPRFILQYRRAQKEVFLQQYLQELLYCIKK